MENFIKYVNIHNFKSISTPSERSQEYLQSAEGLSMAASRVEERFMSSLGLSQPL